MKRCTALLLCVLAISGASGASPHSRLPIERIALTGGIAAVSFPSAAPEWREGWAAGRRSARADFGGLQADVVRDVRATTAFVREAGASPSRSRWLMVLAACGLITMQLRRKHKSLPQRRIAPYV